jgi:hypothetical protein
MTFNKMLFLASAASLAGVTFVPGCRAADLRRGKLRRWNMSAAKLSLVSGNTKGKSQ